MGEYGLSGYLEWHGPIVWLACLFVNAALLFCLWRFGKLARFGWPVLAWSIVLLTPLVYLGHPFIFAPLWIYAFNGGGAILGLLVVWSLLFLVVAGFVKLFWRPSN